MAEIDFYNYKKQITVDNDLTVDLSGLGVKADGNGININAEGGIEDINLNQIIDDKINFIFDDNVKSNEVFTTVGFDESIAYLKGEPVVKELDQINYRDTNETAILNAAGINEALELVSFPIPIIPQHKKMQSDVTGSTRIPLIDREVYAILGMWDTNSFKISDYGLNTFGNNSTGNLKMGVTDNKSIGYLLKKFYVNLLNSLKEKLNTIGIDVIVTEFLESKSDGETDDNISGLSRGDNFSKAIIAGEGFLTSKSDIITEVASENIAPVHMSLKELFKAQFESADELRDQLFTTVTDLIDAINTVPYINRIFDDIKEDLKEAFNFQIRYLKDNNGDDLLISYQILLDIKGNPIDITEDQTLTISGGNAEVRDANGRTVNKTDNAKIITVADTSNKYKVKSLEIDPASDYKETDDIINNMIQKLTKNDDGTAIIKEEYDAVIKEDVNIRKLIDTIKSMSKKLSIFTGVLGGFAMTFSLSTFSKKVSDFENIISKIEWFERYTSESIFENRVLIIDSGDKSKGIRKLTEGGSNNPNDINNPNRKMARALIAVDFGITRIRTRRKSWFRRARYKRIDNGVRWVELRFIDTRVLSLYRPNEREAGVNLLEASGPIPSTLSIDRVSERVTLITSADHPVDVDTLQIEVKGVDQSAYNGFFKVTTIVNSTTLIYTLPLTGTELNSLPNPTGVNTRLNAVINPLGVTQPDGTREEVEILYNIPHLPFDNDLRDEAYFNYGNFDQTEYSNREGETPIVVTTNNDTNLQVDVIPEGYEIFPKTSKEIIDLRDGVDIYNKVQFLLKILQSEFNSTRVRLIETTRSWENQENLQTGGKPSNFLSWHNYGLAVKILITKEDGITPIVERDENEFCRIADIATAFIEDAKNGKFGVPMNVIWCAQLVTNPDMFVWEFLPIGVKHGDAWKFRQSVYNQQDPVIANAFINVDQRNYVINDDNTVPDDNPYIRQSNTAYQNALVINGEKYVHPLDINQFDIPNNLILKDIQEFLFMVRQKMNAHGKSLDSTVPEWKAKNPISFQQLLVYYSLIGNFNAARGLLACDYIEKFDYLVNNVAETNPIDFLIKYLGEDEYQSIKIYIKNSGDISYITLHDGKISIPVADVRSLHPSGNGNSFGEKQINIDSAQFGRYNSEGIFIPESPENPLQIIVSEEPVITGYNDAGEPVDGDALLLHIIIKNKILEEYNAIKELIENLKIDFAYDNLLESPNANQINLIENEFGVIRPQTLLEQDGDGDVIKPQEVCDILQKMRINDQKIFTDGTVRGLGPNIEEFNQDADFDPFIDRNENQSVFEKLVSNAQLQGIQKAKLTKEKPVIEPLQGDVTVEKIIKEIYKENTPDIRDIL